MNIIQGLHVVVVLPTYNERENIKDVLEGIYSREGRIDGFRLSVLVVDDNSPDGTGELVEALSEQQDHLHVLASLSG